MRQQQCRRKRFYLRTVRDNFSGKSPVFPSRETRTCARLNLFVRPDRRVVRRNELALDSQESHNRGERHRRHAVEFLGGGRWRRYPKEPRSRSRSSPHHVRYGSLTGNHTLHHVPPHLHAPVFCQRYNTIHMNVSGALHCTRANQILTGLLSDAPWVKWITWRFDIRWVGM